MNSRERAVNDLIAKFKKMDIHKQDDFLRELFRRMPDMNLFALYVEVFGYAVGEVDLSDFRARHPLWPEVLS